MKNRKWFALSVLVSMTAACSGGTESSSDPNSGKASLAGHDGPSSPPEPKDSAPDAGKAPDAQPAPAQPDAAPAPACTPLPKQTGSANPSSVYCAALGYQVVGSQCSFPDGTSCEEWAFYRGECGQAHSFCNLHGGTISNAVEDMGGWTATYALCTLSNGEHCQEDVFAQSCGCK